MEKMAWDGPEWGREDFFPTNPDLADIWGRTDLIFETFRFFFLFFGSQNFEFPGPQISEFLDFQVPRSPNSQNPKFPGSQISRRRRRRRKNSQIPTWPLSQRTQGSNTSQGPLLRSGIQRKWTKHIVIRMKIRSEQNVISFLIGRKQTSWLHLDFFLITCCVGENKTGLWKTSPELCLLIQ